MKHEISYAYIITKVKLTSEDEIKPRDEHNT